MEPEPVPGLDERHRTLKLDLGRPRRVHGGKAFKPFTLGPEYATRMPENGYSQERKHNQREQPS